LWPKCPVTQCTTAAGECIKFSIGPPEPARELKLNILCKCSRTVENIIQNACYTVKHCDPGLFGDIFRDDGCLSNLSSIFDLSPNSPKISPKMVPLNVPRVAPWKVQYSLTVIELSGDPCRLSACYCIGSFYSC